MHRSSETISAIAAALARACEPDEPRKAADGDLRSAATGEGERTFRYASLASGLCCPQMSVPV
jgi:hypothetical protein